jgi:hypothetical protein
MSSSKVWIVTTSGDRPIAAVAKDLAAAGFQVDSVLDAIGMITGRCSVKAIASVKRVKGVSAVEADAPVDIGPPDSQQSW